MGRGGAVGGIGQSYHLMMQTEYAGKEHLKNNRGTFSGFFGVNESAEYTIRKKKD